MLIKEKVIETIQSLPEKFSLDEVVERLIVLHKIEVGLKQVAEGKIHTSKEAKGEMAKVAKYCRP